MNLRRIVLDVDKATKRPTLIELAAAITECSGVKAINITVGELDLETVDMDVTIEGDHLDYEVLVHAIESTGAVVHSVDQVVAGDHVIESVPVGRGRRRLPSLGCLSPSAASTWSPDYVMAS